MDTPNLTGLSNAERKELIKLLHRAQMGYCFTCNRYIALLLWDDTFLDSLIIGFIESNKIEEKGEWFNFSLNHSSCDKFSSMPSIKK